MESDMPCMLIVLLAALVCFALGYCNGRLSEIDHKKRKEWEAEEEAEENE